MKNQVKHFVLLIVFFNVLSNCSKGDSNMSSELPIVATTAVSAITQTSAKSGGNVISEGSSPVNFRGVCWSTHQLPTIADNKTSDGNGLALFTSSLTGLTDGSTYYLRAYATNSFGTAYGDEVIFVALVIGQNYQGGLIAYLLQPGDAGFDATVPHGLVCTPTELSGSEKWYNFNDIETMAKSEVYGSGYANTLAIVSTQGAGQYAAQYCNDLVFGGHDDWYLPSRDELNKLYLNRIAIGNFSLNGYYWSSTERSIDQAWIQSFSNGGQSTYVKSGVFHIRAIRTF
tara:strand:- start:1968 stop:2825 length:858 start_codon:yes stop_codon:yes gene_type:complete